MTPEEAMLLQAENRWFATNGVQGADPEWVEREPIRAANVIDGLRDEVASLREAVKAHVAWMDHEASGPVYPDGITRDNGGEAIWKEWWHRGLDLCRTAEDRARKSLGDNK